VKNELENFQATEQGKAQEQLEENKNRSRKTSHTGLTSMEI